MRELSRHPRLAPVTHACLLEFMCDECLRLGTPWLPALHGGKPRVRAKVRRAKPIAIRSTPPKSRKSRQA
ncbi:MAG: hypothetical protein K9M98_15150 [Cephaloticoccus sp.]|nr:hypothetical protein [Cephaloticoccus sp.]MCF7761836.1 hypothetical protein [Cephaloticoccus sp.]